MRLIIVQPWFSGIGHPAQSLINMASSIGRDERVDYLVSLDKSAESCMNSMKRLKAWGEVYSFDTRIQTGRSNTVRALWALGKLWIKGHRYQRIFFFDATLPVLALLWPVFLWLLAVERFSVLHLQGPEVSSKSWLNKLLITRFLKRPEVRLYLRTEELAEAWADSFRAITSAQIRHLPSLEIPEGMERQFPAQPSEQVRFGIIGQIRSGKGIDWLVPIFQKNPAIGKLTVAGTFFSQACREQLSVLDGFDGFVNCFMPEDEMLERAAMQDYLLMLYDQAWDPRLESAVLYLAARVNRPVVVYGGSWSGRMVKEFGCGLLAPVDRKETVELLQRVPRPGGVEYAELLKGVEAFRNANSVESLRGKVLDELFG